MLKWFYCWPFFQYFVLQLWNQHLLFTFLSLLRRPQRWLWLSSSWLIHSLWSLENLSGFWRWRVFNFYLRWLDILEIYQFVLNRCWWLNFLWYFFFFLRNIDTFSYIYDLTFTTIDISLRNYFYFGCKFFLNLSWCHHQSLFLNFSTWNFHFFISLISLYRKYYSKKIFFGIRSHLWIFILDIFLMSNGIVKL